MLLWILHLPFRPLAYVYRKMLERENRKLKARFEEYLKTLPPEEQKRERAELEAKLAEVRERLAKKHAARQAGEQS